MNKLLGTVSLTSLFLLNLSPVVKAGDTNIYVENDCRKGLTLWYEWITNGNVDHLEKIGIEIGEKKFIKSSPYEHFRYYAKMWGGGYEWDGTDRSYFIDGKTVKMRSDTIPDVENYTVKLPCSNF